MGSHLPVLPARRLATDPAFLAAAIRWYVEHPADRAEIGTPSGHVALVAQVSAGSTSAPASSAPSIV